ncbi:MAG: mandelate racemase/muconate lactonizing enzyme family protein [Dehalococcoidia bacterium]
MKITDLRTAIVAGNFDWIYVRIDTDEGLSGLGEAYWGAGVEPVIRELKPFLVGEDPANIDWLFNKLLRYMSGAGSQAGTVVTAIGGVEIALWDLAGKALGVPIYRLLGGRYRDRVRVYADCGQGDEPTPESWAERARTALAGGFTAIKFDIDNVDPERFGREPFVGLAAPWARSHRRPLASAELDRIVELVVAVREAVGPHVDLALDCHWNYAVSDAIRLAEALEPFDLAWLEDPVPPENWEAMSRVTDAAPMPICTGENLYTCHGMRDLIVNQACDIIQPDIPKTGGILESRRIADLADLYYMHVAAHNVSSPIATMAAAHACASMRNFTVLEFHAMDVPWWDDLVKEPAPLIHDGYLALSEAPGIGLTLNEEVARAHLREGSTYFGA